MKKVWVEKYRPKSVDKIIMPNHRFQNDFQSYVKDGAIPNLLLYGGPGTGKSSMSMALIRDLGIEKMDVMKINCSDEKIDALRDKVKGFATTMAMGKFKVVRLEEFDYLNHEAQALLRALIEEVSDSCRFIATCNYISKITPPLRSRFQEYEMLTPNRDEVMVLGAEILEAEGIKFEIDDLDHVVASTYPDVRKMIQKLESSSRSGELKPRGTETVHDWKLDLLPALEEGDLAAARKIVCETATEQELGEVYRFLFDNISRVKKLKGHIDDAIVLIAEYQYKHAFVADKEINVAALFCELSAL